MKCRQLSFYAEPAIAAQTMQTIADDIIPRYLEAPHFLGYVVLQSDPPPGHDRPGGRREITVMSFWEDGLEGSEPISKEFVGVVNRVAGTHPIRKSYDLLRAMWRNRAGDELTHFP